MRCKSFFNASSMSNGAVGAVRVYALAQCMAYLSPDQCSFCLSNLDQVASSSRNICSNAPGVRVHYPSCFVRYDNFPFYEERQDSLASGTNTVLAPHPSSSPLHPHPTQGRQMPIAEGKEPFRITKSIVGISIAVISTILLLPLCIFLLFKFRNSKEIPHGMHKPPKGEYLATPTNQGEIFLFDQLKDASSDFHYKNKLGEGGYGAVYKGALVDGREVAIKKLHARSQQGEREFLNEVNIISTVQHRNLIRLYGCCAEGSERLLVYEYLKNQSLDKHIFDGRGINLTWRQRYNIIIGIARGLAYLHEDSRVCIIHRDIKPSNILLDDNLSPKIADFGLARLFPNDGTHVSTKIAGTFGYLAPEYAMQGFLTEKSDTYSFGLVVLETISGRKSIDPHHNESLLDIAWKAYVEKGEIVKLVDSRLQGDWVKDEAERVVQIALLCLQEKHDQRPPMSRVVIMLLEQSYRLDVPVVPSWIRGNNNPLYPVLSASSLLISPR